jgi:hypothetical protein
MAPPPKGTPEYDNWRRKLSEAAKGNKRCVGRVISEETRKKIGDSNRGKRHTEETKRKMSESTKGTFVSEETRQKLSDLNRGSNNPMWKDGSSDTHYRRIRKTLKPDICEHCGTTNARMATHHIDKDHTNNNIENILVLCNSCHTKLHNHQGDLRFQWSGATNTTQ